MRVWTALISSSSAQRHSWIWPSCSESRFAWLFINLTAQAVETRLATLPGLVGIGYTELFEIGLEEPEMETAAVRTGEYLTRLCQRMSDRKTAESAGTGDM